MILKVLAIIKKKIAVRTLTVYTNCKNLSI